MQCDGCGQVKQHVNEPDGRGFAYCGDCAARREGDPTVVVHGRLMTASELEMQADSDEHLANALRGDSVQEQLR